MLDPFLALAATTDDPVFVWKPGGEMLWVNRAFERETGMSVADFQFKDEDNPFIHPEDLHEALAALGAFDASAELVSAPIANRFFDAWGKVLSVVSIVHKVTWQGKAAFMFVSRPQRQQPGEDEVADYRSLLEAADDGIVKLDADGRILYSNRRFQELCGLGPVELHRLTLGATLRQPSNLDDMLTMALAGARLSVRGRLASGRELAIRLSPLHSRDSAKVILAIVRDLGEVQRAEAAERALADNERRVSFLTANVPTIMLYQLQMEESGERRFRYVSAGVETMHGLTPEQVLADASLLYAQIHEQDRERIRLTELASIRDDSPFELELRSKTPHGMRWILRRSAPRPLPDGGRIWDGVEIDITNAKQQEEERVRLEESLRHAQKMESVGRLAGGVAHDFNNMLMVILGNIALAQLRLAADDPLREHLEEATAAARAAENLTKQLLAFSRKQVVVPKVLNLNEVAERILKMLARLLGEDIELCTSLAEDLGAVYADAGQFEQILVNLAVNARDAMPGVGKLRLTTENVRLDAAHAEQLQLTAGDFVLLTVADNGTGMTADVKARLFEPFFTTKAVGKGTGLGLALVYGAVKQSGGGIEVWSEPGKGSEFRLYWPRVEAAAVAERPAPRVSLLCGSESILLVEDEELVRNLARSTLQRQGYRVIACANGGEALDVVAQSAPGSLHLLLTDLVMPGMMGRELAERVIAQMPSVRVIYTSGYTEDAVVHSGIVAENIEFLPKPYSLEELSRRVRRVLDAP